MIIAPTVRGFSIEWLGIIHETGNITIQKDDAPPSMSVDLCPQIQQFGIKKWDFSLLNTVWQLRSNAHGILLLLLHLQEIMELPFKDLLTQELILAYSAKVIIEATQNVQKISDLYSEYSAVMLHREIDSKKYPAHYNMLVSNTNLGTWFLPSLPDKNSILGKEELANWIDAVRKAVNSYEQQLDWAIEVSLETE